MTRRRGVLTSALFVGALSLSSLALGNTAATAAGTQSSGASVSISATSGNVAVSDDIYVYFDRSGDDTASINASYSSAPTGSTLELFASTFPFKAKAASVGSDAVSGTGSTSFTEQPSLATKYTAELFKSGSTKPIATSNEATVYADSTLSFLGSAKSCTGKNAPTCHQKFTVELQTPASVGKFETAKKRYGYLGVDLAVGVEPPPPTKLERNSHFKFSKPVAVNKTEWKYTVSFSFKVPKGDGWYFDTDVCTKDAESSDGIGLPGHHGCGNKSVSTRDVYLG